MKDTPLRIDCFNLFSKNPEGMIHVSTLFRQQAELRYNVLKPLGWDVDFDDLRGTELDEYDRRARYFTYYDVERERVAGCVRLNRVNRPLPQRRNTLSYMLRDHFQSSSGVDFSPYETCEYREGSRLCVDSDYDQDSKRQIVNSLLIGMMMYCARENAVGILGLMHPRILKATWSRLGLEPDNLGEPFDVGNDKNVDLAQAHIALSRQENVQVAITSISHAAPEMVWR